MWLIELAALSDVDLLEAAVCSVLGVREVPGRSLRERLIDELDTSSALLVLDNCEHLIEGCAALVDFLLHSCNAVHVLATSREALSVGGEMAWLVPPLSSPEPRQADSTKDLLGSEAAQLFVQRASAAASRFAPTERNAAAIAELCHKLDGMPLAIELAAARVGSLSVPQLVQRLGDSLALLTGGPRTASPRHRTLRATLRWSYELLDERERILLARLSMFAGGWTVEAAEAVGSGEGIAAEEIVDALGGLVAKSMIQAEPGTGNAVRYTMLEPLRQFGHELLDETTDVDRRRDRHAEYYLSLAEEPMPGGQSAWLARLAGEQANLRVALGWLLETHEAVSDQRAEAGVRLAARLARGYYWTTYGITEGRMWLRRGLAQSASPNSMRVNLLYEAGWLANYCGDYPDAIRLLEQALRLAEQLADPAGEAMALAALGHVAMHRGHIGQVRALARKAEALCARLTGQRGVSDLRVFLSAVALIDGCLDLAEDHAAAGLALSREIDDPRCVALSLELLGIVALERGDHARATGYYREDMHLQRVLKDQLCIAYGLRGLAAAAGLGGDRKRAARLWGAATALSEAIGLPLSEFDRAHPDYEAHVIACGALADKAAVERGRTMSVEEAVEDALAAPSHADDVVAKTQRNPLTAREREVLARLAEGLTNKEIAAALVISVATVERHLATIYRKIGARGRADAAVYALSTGLIPPA